MCILDSLKPYSFGVAMDEAIFDNAVDNVNEGCIRSVR
jgi:hypothetical protein